MTTIGIVCEGKHDDVIIRNLLSAELNKAGITELNIKNIQPPLDQTGSVGAGGWVQVMAWCRKNGGKRLESFFSAAFEDDIPCDAIVVQIDGDALSDIRGRCSGGPIALPVSAKICVDYIANAINEWLQANPAERNKIIFAVPVKSSEAWILAAEYEHHDLESMDAKTEFRRTFSPSQHKSLDAFYELRALLSRDHTDLIYTRSISYAHFVDGLNTVVIK